MDMQKTYIHDLGLKSSTRDLNLPHEMHLNFDLLYEEMICGSLTG